MKTELYKEITTEKVMTFEELKAEYAEANNSDLPIDDDSMNLIIMENLYQNGGNIMLINEADDEILAWCNDYAEYCEADRYIGQEERDTSIRDIYCWICEDNKYVNVLRMHLQEPSGRELLERLEKLIKEI